MDTTLALNQIERRVIWTGQLDWHDKRGPPVGQLSAKPILCQVYTDVIGAEPEVNGDGWPSKLIMQLIPEGIVASLGDQYFREAKNVLFVLQNGDTLCSLTAIMDSGSVGCVHFSGSGLPPSTCGIKLVILLYSKERNNFLGFIPSDQPRFVDRIREVIQQRSIVSQTLHPGQFQGQSQSQGQGPSQSQGQGPSQSQGQGQGISQQPLGSVATAVNNHVERHIIWRGVLEWRMKQNGQNIPIQVPCQITSRVVGAELQIKGDGWPRILIMQIIPRGVIEVLGEEYFTENNCKTVHFVIENCNALSSLSHVMDAGFAGCVHFTRHGMQQPTCSTHIAILIYHKDRNAYVGFIPSNQTGFVDRIRHVIRQKKAQQALMLQEQGLSLGRGMPHQVMGQMGQMAPGIVQPGMPQMLHGVFQPGIPQMTHGIFQQGMPQMAHGIFQPGMSQMTHGIFQPGMHQMPHGIFQPGMHQNAHINFQPGMADQGILQPMPLAQQLAQNQPLMPSTTLVTHQLGQYQQQVNLPAGSIQHGPYSWQPQQFMELLQLELAQLEL